LTNEDFERLRRIASDLNASSQVGILSPTVEAPLFPRATHLPRKRWDLNHPGTQRFDLIIGANVFLCSGNPDRWFANVLASCKYFVIQDVVRRKRGPVGEFGPDGDQTRFAVGDERPRTSQYFDLATLGDRVLGFRTYFGGANEYDDEPTHFVAVLRGDLAEPVLRIDGYPSGVNVPPWGRAAAYRVLEAAEERDLSYHLGLIPSHTKSAVSLKDLANVIPAMLGTATRLPYEQLVYQLTEGRTTLEQELGTSVSAYIPARGRAGRGTGRALADSGFRYYLADRPLRGCDLPFFAADFSGSSAAYRPASAPNIVALDLPTESQLLEGDNEPTLARLLDDLVARKATERQRGVGLARAIAQG